MEKKAKYQGQSLLFLLTVIGIILLINLIGSRVHERVDLTQGGLYTLSDGTKQILKQLEDRLTVRVYFSEKLPPPFNSHERVVRDLLDEYVNYGNGKVKIEIIHPEGNEELEKQAEDDGIQKVAHRVIQRDEGQIKEGYRGVAFLYRGEVKSIPVLPVDVRGLEYEFSSAIRETLGKQRKIGFVTGHDEYGIEMEQQNPYLQQKQPPNIAYLNKIVKQHKLEPVDLAKIGQSDLTPDNYQGLVIAGPKKSFTPYEMYLLDQYLLHGGSIALFIDGSKVEENMLGITAAENPAVTKELQDWLQSYGVEVSKDMVMDTQVDQYPVSARIGPIPTVVPRPYPPWVYLSNTEIDQNHPVVFRLPGLTFLWPSTVRFVKSESNVKGVILGHSTEKGWNETGTFDIDPKKSDQDWLKVREESSRKGKFPLAVAVEGEFHSHWAGKQPPTAQADDSQSSPEKIEQIDIAEKPGRLIVVGDSDFMDPDYLTWLGRIHGGEGYPSDLSLLLNSLDWLVEDSDLITVRAKQLEEPQLKDVPDKIKGLVKWGNVIIWPFLLGFFGLLRWRYRMNLRGMVTPRAEVVLPQSNLLPGAMVVSLIIGISDFVIIAVLKSKGVEPNFSAPLILISVISGILWLITAAGLQFKKQWSLLLGQSLAMIFTILWIVFMIFSFNPLILIKVLITAIAGGLFWKIIETKPVKKSTN